MQLRSWLLVASTAISKKALRRRLVSGVNGANGCRVVGAAIANVVGRVALMLCLGGALSACAESVHQTERLSTRDFILDPGYAGAQSYAHWPGPGFSPGYGIGYGAGYWGHPLGYYGLPYGAYGPAGFGWYGGYGGFGAARPPAGSPGPRPSLPPNTPSRFRKGH